MKNILRKLAGILRISFCFYLEGMLSTILILFVFTACSHKNTLDTFNKYYYKESANKAYKYAKSQAGNSGDVLWNLQAGVSAFEIQNEDTHEILQQGENLFNKYESQGLLGGIFGNTGGILINENVKTYRGNIYEGVMFNYYKALNAMANGDYALARVEFNRANDRQRRAKDYFRKDIQKALNEQKQQNAQDENLKSIDTSSSDKAISPILQRNYSNLRKFNAYTGFINPSISYVSALFFMLENDYEKAMDLYKESYGINNAPIIASDLEVLEKRKYSYDESKYTWVIIEDGQSAQKIEISLNLPAYLVSSNVLHVGISLPELTMGRLSAKDYRAVSTNGPHTIYQASEISDLDRVIANEFEKQLPFIVTRAISSAILKSATQSVLSDHFGIYGALVGMLYSMGTNSADIRISTALPKRMMVLQISHKQEDVIIESDGKKLYHLHFLEDCEESKNVEKSNKKIKNKKNTKDFIVLCRKNDNILHLRTKHNSSSYRILKGGISE